MLKKSITSTYPAYEIEKSMYDVEKYDGRDEVGSNASRKLIRRIRGLNSNTLVGVGSVLKRSLERYIILDKAYNIAREADIYNAIIQMQQNMWNEIRPNVGYKNYNVRDAIWDAMIAEILKEDLSSDEYAVLFFPYGTTLICDNETKSIEEYEPMSPVEPGFFLKP